MSSRDIQINIRPQFGVDAGDLFFLMLFYLKMTTHPEWSWWLVFIPLLVGIAAHAIGVARHSRGA
jgi:hypothetical protein